MTKWCYNYLSVTGPQVKIDKLKKQLNAPFEQTHESWNATTNSMEFNTVKYSEPLIAFHNIYNHIQDGISFEAYHSSSNTYDSTMSVDQVIAQMANEMESGQNWHDWNCRNWGTKWDIAIADDEVNSDTEIYDEQSKSVGYKFSTADSPPFPAMQKLSKQYPELEFSLTYVQEAGWGGEAIFINGNQENVEVYGWKCIECDHTEDETPYCETCEAEMCPSCGFGEPLDKNRKKCKVHAR
jgi:hypothetical protein